MPEADPSVMVTLCLIWGIRFPERPLAIYAHIGLESTFGDFGGHFDPVSEVR